MRKGEMSHPTTEVIAPILAFTLDWISDARVEPLAGIIDLFVDQTLFW